MELPKRKHPRLKEYDYSSAGAYFLTICTKDKRPLLGQLKSGVTAEEETDLLGAGQMVLTPAGEVCKKYLEKIPGVYDGVFLDCYVIMPDHIHVILRVEETAGGGGQGSGRPTVSGIVHGFKRLTAKEMGFTLWQSSFYDRVIRNEDELCRIRSYIMGNPIKKQIR